LFSFSLWATGHHSWRDTHHDRAGGAAKYGEVRPQIFLDGRACHPLALTLLVADMIDELR